jgi:hypothetical protein
MYLGFDRKMKRPEQVRQHQSGPNLNPVDRNNMALADADSKCCSKCRQRKPLDQFNKHSGSRDGLRGYCKACHTAYSTEWIASNREHYNKRIRDDRAADPDKYRQWANAYRDADKERFHSIKREWVKKNPDKRKAILRKYHSTRHAEDLARVRMRQAVKLLATPAWADAAAIEALYVEARRLGRQVDHIVPLRGKTVCGLHCEANLQPLTQTENKSKGNRWWPDMWEPE